MDRRNSVREDTSITVAAVLVLWVLAVLGASVAGVFEKLALEEIAALSAFATLFAVGALRLDPELRAFTRERFVTMPVALVLDAILLIEASIALRGGIAPDALGTLPHALVLLFVMPVAAAASWAALERLGGRRVRSARGKSPGASPAAT
jgi:hypothetical protein